tara:strand:- start:556 stop:675 length:120 start_codon:yes stop_codon:yes gene_type:complete
MFEPLEILLISILGAFILSIILIIIRDAIKKLFDKFYKK